MTRLIQGVNYVAGVGNVVLPVDLDRDKYIGLCYRTNTLCIKLDDGCFYKNCSISENDLGFIEFPNSVNELGSPVVYLSEPIRGNIHIVSVLTDSSKISDKREGQFKFRRTFNKSVVEIVGDSRSKSLLLNVISVDDSPGLISVMVNNKSTSSKIKLEVGGSIELVGHKEVNISSFEKTVLESINSKDSSKKSSITQTSEKVEVEVEESIIKSKKIILNSDKENMVLGNSLKDLLSSFFDDLSKGKVLTPDGPMPFDPSTIALILSYKPQLENILSKKGFLE